MSNMHWWQQKFEIAAVTMATIFLGGGWGWGKYWQEYNWEYFGNEFMYSFAIATFFFRKERYSSDFPQYQISNLWKHFATNYFLGNALHALGVRPQLPSAWVIQGIQKHSRGARSMQLETASRCAPCTQRLCVQRGSIYQKIAASTSERTTILDI